MFNRSSAPSGNGKVIQLDRFLEGVSLSPLRQIEAYWTALREDGGVPMRSQIDPRGMSATLEYTFILERIAPGMARFRIAGQHLCNLAGMEVRGMPLTAFFTPVARTEVSAILEHIFDTPAVIELDLQGEIARTGAPSISARMLMMPLRSDFGRVDRVLGAMMSTEKRSPSRTPVRFEIASSQIRPLDGMPAADPADTIRPLPQVDQGSNPPGLSEPSVEFGAAPRPEPVPNAAPIKDANVQTPTKPVAIPAWLKNAATEDKPVDRFGTPRVTPNDDLPKAATPRRSFRDVPYLRLVKTDD